MFPANDSLQLVKYLANPTETYNDYLLTLKDTTIIHMSKHIFTIICFNFHKLYFITSQTFILIKKAQAPFLMERKVKHAPSCLRPLC